MFDALPPKLWLPQKPAIIRAVSLDDATLAMPLIGTFAAASVRGLRGSNGEVSLSHIASNQITTDTATYTISGISAGAGHLLIGFVTRANASRTVSSVTYDGNAAANLHTNVQDAGGETDIASWYIIPVAGPTTADVVITLNNTMLRLGYTLLQAAGVGSMTAFDGQSGGGTGSATSTSLNLNVPARGGAVAVYTNTSGAVATWTGLIEEADVSLESSIHRFTSAFATFESAQTPQAISVSHTAGARRAMAAASLSP